MSFLKKLFNSVQEATGVDAGKLAGSAVKTAGYAKLPKEAREITHLDWEWSEGANSDDKGTGRPLRNWDMQTKLNPKTEDIFLTWKDQGAEVDRLYLFFGWQGWPYSMIQKDHPEGYFYPPYVEALWNNEFSSVKHIAFDVKDAPNQCVKFPASKTDNEFYYLKVIAHKKDGSMQDVKGCTLASAPRREKEGYDAVPEGDVLELSVPKGSRDRNAREKELSQKAKENQTKQAKR